MKLAQLIACGVAALCIAIPGVAQAQDKKDSSSAASAKKHLKVRNGQTRKQTFDRIDKNRDGMISRAEAEPEPDLILIFLDADTNNDGMLSPFEFVLIPIIQDDGVVVQ
jgi:hypothetical protein